MLLYPIVLLVLNEFFLIFPFKLDGVSIQPADNLVDEMVFHAPVANDEQFDNADQESWELMYEFNVSNSELVVYLDKRYSSIIFTLICKI